MAMRLNLKSQESKSLQIKNKSLSGIGYRYIFSVILYVLESDSSSQYN